MTVYIGNAAPNAPSITTNPGPAFRDDFDTPGNLNGRTGWTVATRTGFAAQVNAISAANGAAGGTTGSAAYALTATAIPLAVVQRRMGIAPMRQQSIADHLSVSGTANLISMDSAQTTVSNVPTGSFNVRSIVASGAAVIIRTFNNFRQEIGDNLRCQYFTSGSDTRLAVFLNGWPCGNNADADPSVVVSGRSVPLVGAFGMIGNTGAATVREISVSDPATEDWIAVMHGNRVAARNADGSVTLRFKVPYNLTPPARLRYSLFDVTSGDDVAISGYQDVPFSFTAAGGFAIGTATIPSGVLPSGPWVYRIERDRMLAGDSAFAWSPYLRDGHVFAQNGQSLGVNVSRQNITSRTWTAPANSTWISGEPTNVSTLGPVHGRAALGMGNNTTAGAFGQTFNAISGRPVTRMSGGMSAQAIANRSVGSATHNALKESIDRAGGRVNAIFHTDGQSNIGDDLTAYIAALQAIYDDIDATFGYAIPVIIDPVAAAWRNAGFHDIRWQRMRRTQWLMTQNFPSRYRYGAHSLDIQHDNVTLSNGVLHLQHFDGYAEFARRQAHCAAKMLGLQTHDRNGPSLASVTKISATEIRCVYDLNGFDSLTLANTGYANDFNGGMIFSTAATLTSTTIATKIAATGATVDASPSGGQQGINFTFPGGTFPGSVFVWAAWGMNPFNPADNGTTSDPVNLLMESRASMVQGVKSGEPNVALRPYFTMDGTDYMVAS